MTDGDELSDLRARIELLEAERDCRDLLSRYAYGADYNDPDNWLDLFAEDAVVDTISYFGTDPANPSPEDYRPNPMRGREQLRAGLIKGPQTAAMADFATQHHMSGNPTRFQLLDADTAVITTYGVVYGKPRADVQPHVTYQSHTTNRWTFRRVDGQWRISELTRRRMGHPEGAALFDRQPGPGSVT